MLPTCLMTALLGVALAPMLPTAGPVLVMAGLTTLYLLSVAPVADRLLRPLEQGFARLTDAPVQADQRDRRPDSIVVLSSGFSKDRRRSGLARLSATGGVRLTEAIRLLRQGPAARLVVFNYAAVNGRESSSGHGRLHAMSEAAVELGVARDRIIDLAAGYSTRAELAAVAARFGADPVLLVTSAAHMPRALRSARDLGVNAYPAATDFLTYPRDAWLQLRWLPSTPELAKSERALYEYLASLRPGS